MDGVSLPYINRATSENSVFYNSAKNGNQDGPTKTEFSLRMEKLVSMYFPGIDPEASVKTRLNNLEETAAAQSNHNNQTQQTISALSKNVDDVDGNLKELLLNMQNDFDTRLLALKKEYDHRFELQTSENKRLQGHVAALKSDTNQLKRKMVRNFIIEFA